MRRNRRAERLLVQLRDLAFTVAQPTPRVAGAWGLLNATRDRDAFEVGLDYAVGHGMLREDDAPLVRLHHQALLSRTPWEHPATGILMVPIPAGTALLGHPPTPTPCPAVSLGMHPVTCEDFQRFLDATRYEPKAPDTFLRTWVRHPGGRYAPSHRMSPRQPVTDLSPQDALAWCAWAGLTLPTQPLWERAARGDDGWLYPWGNTDPFAAFPPLIHAASAEPAPVGSYRHTRTAWGCQDMLGNVAELAFDHGASGLLPSPTARSLRFVACGPHFRHRSAEPCRATTTVKVTAESRADTVGFRAAWTPPAP